MRLVKGVHRTGKDLKGKASAKERTKNALHVSAERMVDAMKSILTPFQKHETGLPMHNMRVGMASY